MFARVLNTKQFYIAYLIGLQEHLIWNTLGLSETFSSERPEMLRMMYSCFLYFQIRLLVFVALVTVVCSQCNDFAIQYQCMMRSNQKLEACTTSCSGYGCLKTQCKLNCHQDAYRRLSMCITLE